MSNFRYDINTLRAISITAVVLFHFKVQGFNGGFIGVDIFFVISGYLMSSIIFRGITENTFSLLNFYYDRFKRIVPALLFLCVITLFIGWFYLLSIEYKDLGRHVAASIAFVSNILYWREASDYFDANSQNKWLLHTL